MSSINIKGIIENIRARTTVYSPVIEVVVNAIQAIEEKNQANGIINIYLLRKEELDGGLSDVTGFKVKDNGIGFTEEHRESFDTLYTDLKKTKGGKGFGRFICLKHFKDIHIESIFKDEKGFKKRHFSMGKNKNFIVDEQVKDINDADQSGTIVTLASLKKGSYDKSLVTIAKNIVEHLLPYFIDQNYPCPKIYLSEKNNETICLNNFVSNELSTSFEEIDLENHKFVLGKEIAQEEFHVRVFKLYSPRNQSSRISLVAHNREVNGSPIHKYIPEFKEEFYEKRNTKKKDRNYIIKAYVFGSYLNKHVLLERGGFEFPLDNNSFLWPVTQSDIEKEASTVVQGTVGDEINLRKEKKRERVQTYVDNEAPWHKPMLKENILGKLPYNPTNEQIEIHLQTVKIERESKIKNSVKKILSKKSFEDIEEDVTKIVKEISEAGKNDLTHYIALRRKILDIFRKSLEKDDSGTYSAERVVHDIIFPRKGDTDITSFDNHNLWIIDERLNFTTYISSDKHLNDSKTSKRPDILAYGKRVLFRGDNEDSNPITIFEFKKPQRDDFANPSFQEDPVEQIIHYVNAIRDGKCKTPAGRKIRVSENTPFYGYVVCDINGKVSQWLKRVKNFKPMPDGKAWFQWIDNNNLYVEVMEWDKVLEDAEMRNKIFFDKLGI